MVSEASVPKAESLSETSSTSKSSSSDTSSSCTAACTADSSVALGAPVVAPLEGDVVRTLFAAGVIGEVTVAAAAGGGVPDLSAIVVPCWC